MTLDSIASLIDQTTTFIQLGAGAGDQDARANFRDGFTELVKSLSQDKVKKIVLVEPNPANFEALQLCWKDYEQSEIYQIGITPKESADNITFHYAPEDYPHFQVCSTVIAHVKKHYPDAELATFTSECRGVNEFLVAVADIQSHCFLAIDVEGLDFEIMMSMSLENLSGLKWISFEFTNLSICQILQILRKLKRNGYTYHGRGVDIGGFDLLFGKSQVSTWQAVSLKAQCYLYISAYLVRWKIKDVIAMLRKAKSI